MLKLIYEGNVQPISITLDPTASFQSGMIAELKMLGNDIVCGVSSGLAPLGIIDDEREVAFSTAAIDEEVIFDPSIIGTPVMGPSGPETSHDVMATLQNPSIIKDSFVTNYPVELNPKNGVIKIPAGSLLNYASTEGGPIDSIRLIVSYAYQVPNIPGEDTTLGSGKVSVWITARMIAQTDQFDTTAGYPLNAPLFCGLDGKLTTKQPTPNHPVVAIVTGPPTAINTLLEFLWL